MKKFYLNTIVLIIVANTAFAASCSKKLPPETLPPQTSVPAIESVFESTVETSETTTVETTVAHGPFSTPVVTEMPVDVHGALHVDRLNVVDENSEQVVLRGIAVDLAADTVGFINADTVKTLAEDWGCNVIRVKMDLGDETYGYLSDSENYFNSLCNIIDICAEQGVYVIVDLNFPEQCDYDLAQETAVDLFSRLSAIYTSTPNLIYEICSNVGTYSSEDTENSISWSSNVRPYAEAVISAIRTNSPDNIIIVGTPEYQSETALAAISLIEEENLLYSFNDMASIPSATAIGIPLIYTSAAEMTAEINTELTDGGIGWCYNGIGPDGSFDSALLNYSSDILTDDEKIAGHWPDDFISAEGLQLRELILGTVIGTGEEETEAADTTDAADASETTAETTAETTSTTVEETTAG